MSRHFCIRNETPFDTVVISRSHLEQANASPPILLTIQSQDKGCPQSKDGGGLRM